MKYSHAALLAIGLVALVAAAILLLRDGEDLGSATAGDRTAHQAAESVRSDPITEREGDLDPASSERVLVPPLWADSETRTILRGIAYDPDGSAMESVIVAVEQSEVAPGAGGAERFKLRGVIETDVGGSFQLELPAGDYRISAHLATQSRSHDLWFEPETVSLAEGEELVHHIRFVRPRSTICGTITTTLGRPLDVGVALCNMAGKHLRRAMTDGAGFYSIDGVAPGTYRFLVERGAQTGKILLPWRESRAPERSAERWPAVRVDAGDEIVRHDLTLAEPVKVSLRVSLSGPEEFSEGGTVFLREAAGGGDVPRLGEPRVYAFPLKTGGNTTAKTLFPGEYTAYFWGVPDGMARPDPLRLAVRPTPEEQVIDAVFAGAAGMGRIEGLVVDQAGRPIVRARVQLWDLTDAPRIGSLSNTCARAEAVCGDDGAFVITGLPEGRYVLRRDRRPIANTGPLLIDRREDLAVTIAEGSGAPALPVVLDLHAAPRGSLEGRVEIAGVSTPLEVKAVFQPGEAFEKSSVRTTVGPDGAFRFPLIPRVETPVELEVISRVGSGYRAMLASAIMVLPENDAQPIVIRR